MSSIVLDASAILALLLDEPGGQHVSVLLDKLDRAETVQIAISTVTWCEVLTRLHRDHDEITDSDLAAFWDGVEIVPLDRSQAAFAAALARHDRSISLGDRACLALAHARQAAAWTTDKQWARLDCGVTVKVLR